MTKTLALLVIAAAAILSTAIALAAGGGSPAQQGQALFKQDCSGCHTIGGGNTVGPDLKGILAVAGEGTVRDFVTDPTKMIASGDPKIAALVTKFHGVKMPDLGLSSTQVTAIIAYLKTTSGTTTLTPPASTPATPAGNAAVGKSLFTGATQLTNGGAACMSCHSIAGVGALGGGQLGPNLTGAAAKYGGAKGLVSVLSNIAFPRMVPIYGPHPLTRSEQADLAAFLASEPAVPPPAPDHTPLIVLLGLCVTAAILVLMLVVWPRRRLVVRKRIAPTSNLRRT
jgi:mono/diheme cytochrome c family protein